MKTPIYTGIFQSDLDATGYKLVNLPTPVASGDAANKAYVDAHAGGGGGGGVARKFDVKTYGAIGDTTTDDTTAIQAALAAIPSTGGVLYFPAGRYKYSGSTLTLDRKITVEGDGGGVGLIATGPVNVRGQPSVSMIDFNSSTGTLFTVTAQGCGFKCLGFCNTSVSTPSAGAAILVASTGDFDPRTLFWNLTVDGFYIGFDLRAGSGSSFNDCWIIAPVLYGIKLQNLLMNDAGGQAINGCVVITAASRSASAGIRIESGGGIKIVNTTVVGDGGIAAFTNGIDLAVGAGVRTVDLLVANCSIEGYLGSAIKGRTGGSGAFWYNICITGNEFNPASGGDTINFAGTSPGDFDGLVITGNRGYCGAPGTGTMINLSNCSNVNLANNGGTGFSSMVTLGSGVTFADSPVYIGRDARLVSITGGVKIQVRNPGTDTWVDGDSWTNP